MAAIRQENGFFVTDYQPTDRDGNPVGPKQVFRGKTLEELVGKLTASNENATREIWETRKAVRLGELITPDPEQPVIEFQERQLTADDRVRLTRAMQDPATAVQATKELVESVLGAPLDAVRSRLRDTDVRTRAVQMKSIVDNFVARHPEYIPNSANRILVQKWLDKNHYAVTDKNLELALETLRPNLILRSVEVNPPVTEEIPTEVPAAVIPQQETPAEAVSAPPAPVSPVVIPQENTPPTPPISERSAGPRVQNRLTPPAGSSGLRSTAPSRAPAPKVPTAGGFTLQELLAMNSDAFAKLMGKPGFEAEFEKLMPAKGSPSRPQ